MRDFKDTLQWYRENKTTRQIGFNPDGMCLKVCRTARGIPARYSSAKIAQDATPAEHRVHKVRDLRRGMVLYYDDPRDENKFGHVCTMIGRVKGGNVDNLRDVLVSTNSVKRGELVVVRGDYFIQHWGDPFVFGATWLNGVVLDIPVKKEPKPPAESSLTRVQNFKFSRPDWDVKILDRAIAAGRIELRPTVIGFERAIKALPDDNDNSLVKQFKEAFDKDRILKLKLLNTAVLEGRVGQVKVSRDKIRQLIKSLPER